MLIASESLLHLLGGPTVEIVVGRSIQAASNSSHPGPQTTWFIPRALLCYRSSFFRAAFEQSFREKFEKKIALPEDDPEAFQLFFQWLYIDKFIVDDKHGPFPVHPAIKAWVFGDKIGATAFSNYCMKEIFETYTPKSGWKKAVGPQQEYYIITPAVIALVCTLTHSKSKLYRYFLDNVAWYWDHELDIVDNKVDTKQEWDELWNHCPEFRNDLFFRFISIGKEKVDFLHKGVEQYLDVDKGTSDPGQKRKDPHGDFAIEKTENGKNTWMLVQSNLWTRKTSACVGSEDSLD